MAKNTKWVSRIVDHGEADPQDIAANPRNWRVHPQGQRNAINGVLTEIGWLQDVVINQRTGYLVDGHLRVEAAIEDGQTSVPVVYVDISEEEELLALTTFDPITAMAETDTNTLGALLNSVQASEANTLDLLQAISEEHGLTFQEGNTDPDELPEPLPDVSIQPGDVYQLGKHRLMCGDSTSPDDLETLMNGAKAHLLHADPPYGMGKEKDGVENDNLYKEKLDQFQMLWWEIARPHLVHNASAYIWGNPPDLWRLWYKAGLGETEKMELRNQIVWDKKSIPGMASDLLTQYPVTTEHCLYYHLVEQFLGIINTADFPESWEPLRSYLASQANGAGIAGNKDIMRVCNCHMYSHWFTRSQFTLPPLKHYTSLAEAYPGYFLRPWTELKAEWDRVKGRGTDVIRGKLGESRSYFDNAHEIMRDVWEYSRVQSDERYDHATPKPVEMMARVMNSSLPEEGICLEPFAGSGSTLMGAETTGRICYTMELSPRYCDTTIRRWQNYTGQQAEQIR